MVPKAPVPQRVVVARDGSGQRHPCAIRQSMLEGPNCTRALVWP